MHFINYPFLFLQKKMAPNFLDLATTLENLGARWLLGKKVNFVPWLGKIIMWSFFQINLML